jgi:hypothetical protein
MGTVKMHPKRQQNQPNQRTGLPVTAGTGKRGVDDGFRNRGPIAAATSGKFRCEKKTTRSFFFLCGAQ